MKYLVLKTNYGYGGNVIREKGEIVDLDPSIKAPVTIFKCLEKLETKEEPKLDSKEVKKK